MKNKNESQTKAEQILTSWFISVFAAKETVDDRDSPQEKERSKWWREQ